MKLWCFLSLQDILIFTNNADPDDMQGAACHLGLHCLLKVLFVGFSSIQRVNHVNKWASPQENLPLWFPTKRLSNQSAQLHGLARKLKLHQLQV